MTPPLRAPRRRPLRVACAIIERDGRVLAARRGPGMSNALKWEFPGGKIHPREAVSACIAREIREELDAVVIPGDELPPVTFHGPRLSIRLFPVVCRLAEHAALHPVEHAEIGWFKHSELKELDWCPADVPVLDLYLSGAHTVTPGGSTGRRPRCRRAKSP